MLKTKTSSNIPSEIARVLINEQEIQGRIAELGRQISSDYAGRELAVVGILKGSVVFLADLMRHISLAMTVDFICLSSYAGHESSGVVRLLLDLRESIEGKEILLVEDIVDTGLTLSYLLQNLKTRKPRSLEICALLDKPDCRKVRLDIKYSGFQIPNEFVVGFGLDYNEKYRNLPYIGVMKTPAT